MPSGKIAPFSHHINKFQLTPAPTYQPPGLLRLPPTSEQRLPTNDPTSYCCDTTSFLWYRCEERFSFPRSFQHLELCQIAGGYAQEPRLGAGFSPAFDWRVLTMEIYLLLNITLSVTILMWFAMEINFYSLGQGLRLIPSQK